jgi:hypothetical protein
MGGSKVHDRIDADQGTAQGSWVVKVSDDRVVA